MEVAVKSEKTVVHIGIIIGGVVIARRKKGSGSWFSETVLGEEHLVWSRGGVELQQGWPRRPQDGPW